MAKKVAAKTSGSVLTVAEKRAIQGFLEDGLDSKKIAMHLTRAKATVDKYIKQLTAELMEKSAEADSTESEVEELDIPQDKISPELEEKAIMLLMSSSSNALSEIDAKAAINKVRKKIDRILTMADLDALVVSASRQVSAKDSMIRKTTGGRKGIAVGTSASSMRMDHDKENRKPTSRTSRGAIWTQEGKVL